MVRRRSHILQISHHLVTAKPDTKPEMMYLSIFFEQITRPHLEHEVDSTSVRGDSHSAAFWDRLVGCQRDDGLRIRQGLDLQIVRLHQGHSRRV